MSLSATSPLGDGTIKVLLVEDHTCVGDMLTRLLDAEDGIDVIGCAADPEIALHLTRRHNPTIALIDIVIPGSNTFDMSQRLRLIEPELKIVFFSGYVLDGYVDQALRIKADGYLTKNETFETLVGAIRDIAAGSRYFSQEIRSRIVVRSKRHDRSQTACTRVETLTSREHDVLAYLVESLTKKQIAQKLHVSVSTVSRHTENLMAKLDIHDRVKLARFAIREGLVEA